MRRMTNFGVKRLGSRLKTTDRSKMALPTLQPYWMKHYKNKTEQFHVQRTQHESDFRNKWDENSRYFQRSTVEATKKRAWSSNDCFRERFVTYLSIVYIYYIHTHIYIYTDTHNNIYNNIYIYIIYKLKYKKVGVLPIRIV